VLKQTTQHDTDTTVYRPWLHRYACLLTVATFILVTSGGNVTSREAAEAVPDGFTVYGYFLWSFPYDMWVGNIFHEHIHRLKGSVIGLLTIGLTIWLWMTQTNRRWLKRFGLILLLLVLIQGAMGGLRVEFVKHFPSAVIPFAIAHAVTGQIFLCMTVIAAAATSRFWIERKSDVALLCNKTQRRATVALLAIILVQLLLGAAMRHMDAGLAIPDFPTSYGKFWMPMSHEALEEAQAEIPYEEVTREYSLREVHLHFGHRLWAVVVLGATVFMLVKMTPVLSRSHALRFPVIAILVLMILQVGLGASVIWSKRMPDIATAHQSVGALLLALSTLLVVRSYLATPDELTQPVHKDRANVAIGGASA